MNHTLSRLLLHFYNYRWKVTSSARHFVDCTFTDLLPVCLPTRYHATIIVWAFIQPTRSATQPMGLIIASSTLNSADLSRSRIGSTLRYRGTGLDGKIKKSSTYQLCLRRSFYDWLLCQLISANKLGKIASLPKFIIRKIPGHGELQALICWQWLHPMSVIRQLTSLVCYEGI